jgi:hypothetical protein
LEYRFDPVEGAKEFPLVVVGDRLNPATVSIRRSGDRYELRAGEATLPGSVLPGEWRTLALRYEAGAIWVDGEPFKGVTGVRPLLQLGKAYFSGTGFRTPNRSPTETTTYRKLVLTQTR